MKTEKLEYVEKFYKTTDLHLAAFLRCRKWFLRLERNGGQCTFSFIDDPDLQKDVEAYFNDADVGAISFKNELQNLKTMIHNS